MTQGAASAESSLGRRLEEATRALREQTRIPGVAVGLIHGSEHVVAADGVTNVEHPLSVDGRSLFQIASLTKPFTATALMRLVEAERLELEQPLRSLLPEFRLPREEWTDRVRVIHLLTHAGGWNGDRFLITPPRERTLAGLVAEFAENEQWASPGSLWSYDNAAFSVVGRLIEVLTGIDYPAALRELVLDPLGLDHSFFRSDEVVTHRVAAGHIVGGNGAHVLRGAGWQPGWELMPFDRPAGGLISCAEDLLRWAHFHLGDGRSADGTRLLQSDTLRRMQTETGTAGCGDDAVGLAWLLRDAGGLRFFGHGGQTAGYLSQVLLQRESGFALVVLTNTANDGGFRRDLVTWALENVLGGRVEDPEPLAAPPAPDDAPGHYHHPFALQELRRTEKPNEFELVSEAHPPQRGCWRPPPPPPSRWAFYAPDRLVALAPDGLRGARAELLRDSKGRVLWLRSGGRVARRLGDPSR